VFNICVALGALWLVQATAGNCEYIEGRPTPCGGCYLPAGVSGMACPGVSGTEPIRQPGSLQGTVLFTCLCVVAVLLSVVFAGGRLPVVAAGALVALYLVFAVYEVLAAFEAVAPLCVMGVCL